MSRGLLVRITLVYLALNGLFPGAWATFAPRSFYDDFPGATLAWVAAEPPYNEHLVRDVGAFFLALGVLAIVAAVASSPMLTRATGVAWLVFSVPHLGYHLRHLDRYDLPALNVVALALPIVAALVATAAPSPRAGPNRRVEAR